MGLRRASIILFFKLQVKNWQSCLNETVINIITLSGMFLGEMMCMLAFWYTKWRARRQQNSSYPPLTEDNAPKKFNPLVNLQLFYQNDGFLPLQIFLPPALCDMTATSVQYIGLTLTYASSFQMLRGAVIIFTGNRL